MWSGDQGARGHGDQQWLADISREFVKMQSLSPTQTCRLRACTGQHSQVIGTLELEKHLLWIHWGAVSGLWVKCRATEGFSLA